jgi:hypothetical protein
MFKSKQMKRLAPVLTAAMLTSGAVIGVESTASASVQSNCIPTASYPQSDGTAYASISCINGSAIIVNIYTYITRDGAEVASKSVNCRNSNGSANVTSCDLPVSYSTGGAYGSHEWCTVAEFYGLSITSTDEEKDCIHVPGQGETYYTSGWVSTIA